MRGGRQIEGIYSGDINNSAITGSGQFTSNDKAFIYEGGFEDGMLKGAGKLKDNAYLVNFSEVDRVGQYEGDTIDGLADGQGTFQPLILIMSHIHIREAGNRDSFMVMVPGYWKMKI